MSLGTMNDDEQGTRFQEGVSKLDDGQREHFKELVLAILDCYVNEQLRGVMIVEDATGATLRTAIFCINSNELDAARLVAAAGQHINTAVMQDAPPRERFN